MFYINERNYVCFVSSFVAVVIASRSFDKKEGAERFKNWSIFSGFVLKGGGMRP